MFTPSREKVEAAERYLEKVRTRPRSWDTYKGKGGGRQRTGKPLWRQLPPEWHAEAETRLHRLVQRYWSEHGHGPSQQKHASLIGNVVQTILHYRMSNRHNSLIWKFWNARMVVNTAKHIRNPQDRRGFTPRTAKARSSVGNLAGI